MRARITAKRKLRVEGNCLWWFGCEDGNGIAFSPRVSRMSIRVEIHKLVCVAGACRVVVLEKGLKPVGLDSEANGRVVHRKSFAKTYSTNIVEGAGHS